MVNKQMNLLTEDWKDLKQIVLYCYGTIFHKCIDKIQKDFDVICIIDKVVGKQESSYKGIPVLAPDVADDYLKRYKTILMTAGETYTEIAVSLTEKGYIENRDFCGIERLVGEWYWKYRQKNCLMELHTAITMSCSLKCKNCNMFVPYYYNKVKYSLEDIQENFDLLFQQIDYVFDIILLGGEPLLHEQLGEMLQYLHTNYGDRINRLGVITNGTILPSEKLIQIFRECNVDVYVSDYSISVPYQDKIQSLCRLLEDNQIWFHNRPSLKWCDFGFPQEPFSYKEEQIREHMLNCGPIFHGLNDKKFYYCHVAWSAEKCGEFQLTEKDYVDLSNINSSDPKQKRKIVEHSLGFMEEGYVSLCKLCGGCGKDNKRMVQAGEQVKE